MGWLNLLFEYDTYSLNIALSSMTMFLCVIYLWHDDRDIHDIADLVRERTYYATNSYAEKYMFYDNHSWLMFVIDNDIMNILFIILTHCLLNLQPVVFALSFQ